MVGVAMKKMMMTKLRLGLIAGVALCAAQAVTQDGPKSVASAAAAATDATAKTEGFRDRYPRYKIGAGDQFDVNFDLSPEFNQTVTVQPDGYVTMRGVGDLHVQDLTVPELTQ